MDEKTKKKRVEKRGARKKKDLVTVSAGSAAKKKKAKRTKLIASKETAQGKNHLTPTYEQVQLRAYFISEQRRNVGIAGDEHSDWVRAERELRDELLAEKSSVEK
jgi:hypothetical protein